MLHVVQYLLKEISHFHLRPLLGHVGLHLRVCVIDDGKEHVLYRKDENGCFCVCEGVYVNKINKLYHHKYRHPTHHENKEDEEDKGCIVDGSKHWICFLYF